MRENEKSYVYDFGKMDFWKNGKRANAIEVEVTLKENNEGLPVFSASADVWNARHTDIVCGGQCLDFLFEETHLGKDKLFQEIYDLWSNYHLNDMHAGTPRQEEAIEKARADGLLTTNDYTETCDYLKTMDLYEDKEYLVKDKDGNDVPYKYGTDWLYVAIPQADLDRITALVSGEGEKLFHKTKATIER